MKAVDALRCSPRAGTPAVLALLLVCCGVVTAQADPFDRLSFTADADTLSGTNGGGGVAFSWLHNFDAGTLLGVGAEHQAIANAQWTLGSFDGSVTRSSGDLRYTFYADAREGSGYVGGSPFGYSVVDAGVIGSWRQNWSVQLEDRQIDVETIHGNLPKIGLLYLWDQRWLACISYADSVGGNLGTHLAAARLQESGARINPLIGIAYGQAAPPVVDLQTGLVLLPGLTLREGYGGVSFSVPSWHGDVSVIGDYIDLAGNRRAMLTINYMRWLGKAPGGPTAGH
jgi:hypothetical protein